MAVGIRAVETQESGDRKAPEHETVPDPGCPLRPLGRLGPFERFGHGLELGRVRGLAVCKTRNSIPSYEKSISIELGWKYRYSEG